MQYHAKKWYVLLNKTFNKKGFIKCANLSNWNENEIVYVHIYIYYKLFYSFEKKIFSEIYIAYFSKIREYVILGWYKSLYNILL